MASGLDWNSEEEGTAGADALKVEDLIELSEGNSGQSTQACPSRNDATGVTLQLPSAARTLLCWVALNNGLQATAVFLTCTAFKVCYRFRPGEGAA